MMNQPSAYRFIFLFSFLVTIQLSCNLSHKEVNQINSNLSKSFISNQTRLEQSPIFVSIDTMKPSKVFDDFSHFNLNSNDQTINLQSNSLGFEHFVNYTIDQGLALNTVLCAYTDRTGNIWLGTQGGGISKFDGKKFTNYSTIHGLSNNTILCLIEDRKGNFWFGTDGAGIIKYDGISFTNYTIKDGLAGDGIRAILEDSKGRLWFATDDGGISFLKIENILNKKLVFENITNKMGLSSNQIRCLAEDKLGNIWFGTQENGLCKYDGKTFSTITQSNGLAGDKIRCIYKDRSHNLWFGTEDGGVSKYSFQSQSQGELVFENYSQNNELGANSIKSIMEDSKGQIWFCTAENGAFKLLQTNGKVLFKNYTINNGLSSNNVFSATEDQSGNIWFGTYGGGVCRYAGNAFSNFTKQHGLSNNSIWGITQSNDGRIWLGTDGDGICCLSNEQSNHNFSQAFLQAGLKGETIFCSKKDSKGHLWFGTLDKGVYLFDGLKLTNYNNEQGLAGDMVLCIEEDHNGDIWIGTGGNGVSQILFDNNGRVEKFVNYTTNHGLPNDVVLSIVEDYRGNIWLGGQGGGVTKFIRNKNSKSIDSYLRFSTNEGLSNNVINCLLDLGNNKILVGTSNGLSLIVINDSLNNECTITNFSSAHGLPDNLISNLLLMPNGKIAIGTNKGITIINRGLTLDEKGKFIGLEIFNTSTGYPIADVNGQGSMFLDRDGVIWAGTGDDKIGLIRFDYNAVKRNLNPPKVVLENIQINENDISWYNLPHCANKDNKAIDSSILAQQEIFLHDRILSEDEKRTMASRYQGIRFDSISPFYPIPYNLVLPYKNNFITFQFNCIEVSHHNMINYQYKLEGYDDEWSPILKKSEATFGHMSEGNYTFKLKAQSPNGVWSAPIEYSFKVLPPWYRTWWAYLIFIGCAISSIILLLRWRTSGLKKRSEHLKHIVQERTNDLILEKQEVEKQKEEAEKQYNRSEALLLNILPEEIAQELKLNGQVAAKQFQEVTVLFTDFVNFTGISETLSPQNLVSEVHLCYTEFDAIMERNHLEKIKTIGDAYLAVSGIPHANANHAYNAVKASQEIIEFIASRKKAGGLFDIRIGLNSGSVVAGIVGVKKFAYDIWGDTVNTAARMEQNSELGKINISGKTYELIKDKFHCIHRGKIQAKNKGEIDMYFVE